MRETVEQCVMELGGAFTYNLTNDCTHLICYTPSTNKYEHAKKLKIKTVSIDWLNECFKRKGRVEEDDYPVVAPSDETANRNIDSAAAQYLDRCNIFVGEGFDDSVLELIRKVVREGGGSMPRTFDGFVTHYIISGNAPTAK
eukprot:jgi/Hompol1/3908/HPOL_006816-RA